MMDDIFGKFRLSIGFMRDTT